MMVRWRMGWGGDGFECFLESDCIRTGPFQIDWRNQNMSGAHLQRVVGAVFPAETLE